MTTLFQRAVRVTVDTFRVENLDVSFNVERSLKKEPNSAEINIWNLNRDHRKALQGRKFVSVILEAGYKDAMTIIFMGNVNTIFSNIDKADIITSLSVGDGSKAYRAARINKSFSPNTTYDQVIRETAKAMGLGLGNIDTKVKNKGLQDAGKIFSGGTVVSGSAPEELDRLLQSGGFEWSIQNGNLQVLPKGKSLEGTAVLLNKDTGLIGSPTIDAKHVVHAVCLIIPDVFPGRKVKIESEGINGVFRVNKATYQGDTAGNDWQIQLECKAPQ